MEQDDSGLWLRPKASLTPKINANLIQSRGLLRNGSAGVDVAKICSWNSSCTASVCSALFPGNLLHAVY